MSAKYLMIFILINMTSSYGFSYYNLAAFWNSGDKEVCCSAAENASCAVACPTGYEIKTVKSSGYGATACSNLPVCGKPLAPGSACPNPTNCGGTGSTACNTYFNNGTCGDTCNGYYKTGVLDIICTPKAPFTPSATCSGSPCTATCPAGLTVAQAYAYSGASACGNAPGASGYGGEFCSAQPSCTGSGSCTFDFGACADNCSGAGKSYQLSIICH